MAANLATDRRELLAEPRGVGVDCLSEHQLVTDGKNDRGHAGIVGNIPSLAQGQSRAVSTRSCSHSNTKTGPTRPGSTLAQKSATLTPPPGRRGPPTSRSA